MTWASPHWPGGDTRQATAGGTFSCIVDRRLCKSIQYFHSRLQFLLAFRDSIKVHRSLRDVCMLHCDVNVQSIPVGRSDAEGGWKGALVDFDLATLGTRAFQSVKVLKGNKQDEPRSTGSRRVMRDYLDDLESFYWCFCWVCFNYDGPRTRRGITHYPWQTHDPATAATLKTCHLLSGWDPALVRPCFRRDFGDLLLNAEAEKMYNHVLRVVQAAIDDLGPEDQATNEEEDVPDDSEFGSEVQLMIEPPSTVQKQRAPTRKSRFATTIMSLQSPRKADEESSDTQPEHKR
ncbi:hypothetical protein HDZ31DRAFT_65916 [Schizophyllum fasciatum]